MSDKTSIGKRKKIEKYKNPQNDQTRVTLLATDIYTFTLPI